MIASCRSAMLSLSRTLKEYRARVTHIGSNTMLQYLPAEFTSHYFYIKNQNGGKYQIAI